MRCRHSSASVAVALAALASPVSGATKSCNGKFECSGFDFNYGGYQSLSRAPFGGTEKCTYGHIEAGGTCDSPCTGVRQAMCRCKTKTEAEEAVAAEAKTNLYISIAVLVLGLAVVVYSGYARMKAQKRMREIELMRQQEPELAEQPPPEVQPPPQMSEPTVVNATVVGVSDPSQPPSNQQPVQGDDVVTVEPLQKSPSQMEIVANNNPNKTRLISLAVIVGLPVFSIGYYVWQITQSQNGIFDTFSLFMGFVAMACYLGYLTVHVSLAMRVGFSAFVENIKRNPARFFLQVQARLCWFLPVIGVAGVIWAFRRMGDPSGVYSTC